MKYPLRLLGCICCATQLGAQTTVKNVPSSIACTVCRIEVASIGRLATESGPGAISSLPLDMAQDAKGRVFLIEEMPNVAPRVYLPNGKFLQDIGRTGKGPNEYGRPGSLTILQGDTILIFDGPTRRVSVLSPVLQFVNSEPLSANVERATPLSDGTIAVVANIGAGDAIGFPVHRLGRDGKRLNSFGVDSPFVMPGRYPARPQLAAARNGNVWVAEEMRYRISLWSATGKRLLELRRTASWFPAHEPRSINPEHPPLPWVVAVHEDPTGLLWVFTLVPRKNWLAGVGKKVQSPEGQGYMNQDFALLYETRIEVLDPAKGTLMASVTVPHLLVHVLRRDGVVAGWRTNSDGGYVVELWKVTLQR